MPYTNSDGLSVNNLFYQIVPHIKFNNINTYKRKCLILIQMVLVLKRNLFEESDYVFVINSLTCYFFRIHQLILANHTKF